MLLLGFGERSKSAGAVRIVRRRAAELNLDWSHFRGKRRWSDAQLKQAVTECRSWDELLSRLGLSTKSGNIQPHIKSHTVRLGLDTSHLNRLSHNGRQPAEPPAEASELATQRRFLRVAAGTLAATWFMLRGCAVSFPAEPTRYDLLAETPQGIMRVQVKTTTSASKYGWQVGVGHHPDTHSKKGQLLAYSPDEIDLFFIVDGDMTMYLIPSRAIAGRISILLRTYRKYIVGNARGLLGVAADTGGAGVPASA
jgi:PD-(D/E)XK endonuclease